MVAVEGVGQAVSYYRVLQRSVTHFHACSHVQGVRSLKRESKIILPIFSMLLKVLTQNQPCSCSPCLLPPLRWTLQPGWTERPDTRPSAQSHTPSDSSRPGQGRGSQRRHWPDVLGSARDLKHKNKQTVRQLKITTAQLSSSFAGVSPAVKTCPMMTSETSSGFTPARFRTSLITTEHRSRRGTAERAPLKDPGNKLIHLLSSGYRTRLCYKQSNRDTFCIVNINANACTHKL